MAGHASGSDERSDGKFHKMCSFGLRPETVTMAIVRYLSYVILRLWGSFLNNLNYGDWNALALVALPDEFHIVARRLQKSVKA